MPMLSCMNPVEVHGNVMKLHDCWTNGLISDAELPSFIPAAWLAPDAPERDIGADECVRLFKAAGFFTHPADRGRPSSLRTLYRGATVDRRIGMSWTIDATVAALLGRRHAFYGPAFVYRTEVAAQDVLAVMFSPTDDADTFIIDPRRIQLELVSYLPDPRRVGV
jgi:hypothetical protein